MKYIPLDELEMFEIMRAVYPEKFRDDSDETFEQAQIFADELAGWEDISKLLGRVATLTMPMEAGITKQLKHCLGKVEIKNNKAIMVACVTRDIEEN